MASLRDDFGRTGGWLFRHRSFLPLFLLIVVVPALISFTYPYGSHRVDQIWEGICLTVSLTGLAVRFITVGFVPKGTSGRITAHLKADSLNTTGIYSIVRHPLYLANFFVGLGMSMILHIWWLPVLYGAAFWLYYERIMFAEEEYLREQFGDDFLDWANKTPVFVPKVSGWSRSTRLFSFPTALKREYRTFILIIAVFTVFEIASDFFATGGIVLDPLWIPIFGCCLLTGIVIRVVHKHTRLLKTHGR